jgi:hypothetical protein
VNDTFPAGTLPAIAAETLVIIHVQQFEPGDDILAFRRNLGMQAVEIGAQRRRYHHSFDTTWHQRPLFPPPSSARLTV